MKQLAKQWDEIRHLNLANDVLVVLKRDGKSLDYVEGVLGDITDDKVEFKLDGESNRVDRAKVAGIIYYRADRRTTAEPRMVVARAVGPARERRKGAVRDSTARTSRPPAAPSSRGRSTTSTLADFSAGKVMYLSDIEPASQKWTPLVGLPTGVTLAAEYGQPRRDHSAFGGPLIADNDRESDATPRPRRAALVQQGPCAPQPNRTGVSAAGRFQSLDRPRRHRPGHHAPAATCDCPFSPTTARSSKPKSPATSRRSPLMCEITGAKRLKIVVDFGQNLDTGDWLNLCDAKIVK